MAKKTAAKKAAKKEWRDDLISKIHERVCAEYDRDRAAELATLAQQQSIRGWRLPEQVAASIADEVECLQQDAQRCHSSDELRGVLFNAVANGFTFAVERYLDELRDVPELQQLRDREQRRKAKATTGKTAKRSQRALEAQRMLDQGASIDDIAAAFGRTRSTVYRWLELPPA